MSIRSSRVDASRVNLSIHRSGLKDALLSPVGIQLCVVAALVSAGIAQATALLSLPLLVILLIVFGDRQFRMPLRMPLDVGGIDYTNGRETPGVNEFMGLKFTGISRFVNWVTPRIVYEKAAGIMCLGYAREKSLGRELWLTLSDALRHMMVMATTGSGKTEALLTMLLNAICWGRGSIIIDGKAVNMLAFALHSLARRFGREDDFYIINFLTGGEDPYAKMLANDKTRAPSNSVNILGYATPTFIIQLMESLLPVGNGSDEGWKDKARAMINALIYALCYKRARDNMVLSQAVIQEYLPLRKLVGLYREALKNGWHKDAYRPLENYLSTLAGFDMKLINKPSEWSSGVFDQHGFLIQQFTKMLGTLNDTYRHVFPKNGKGDIDFRDVLHNDRILGVLIPSLELSSSESAMLGKLIISSVRMTISQDLGFNLEGMREDIAIADRFKNKFPFLLQFDEIGYYSAPGMDKMAAQLRGLQYMLVLLGQDAQAQIRNGGGEFDSVKANLGTKWFLALEDEGVTFDIIKAAAGKSYFSELATVERKSGLTGDSYQDVNTLQIRRDDNLDLAELKGLPPGEGVIVHRDALVRSAAIFIPDKEKLSAKLPMRINRFVNMKQPVYADLCERAPELQRRQPVSETRIENILARLDTVEATLPVPGSAERVPNPLATLSAQIIDPVLCRLATLAADPGYRHMPPTERGILLFETARRELESSSGHYRIQKAPPVIKVTRKRLEQAHSEQQAFQAEFNSSHTQPQDTFYHDIPHDYSDMPDYDTDGFIFDNRSDTE